MESGSLINALCRLAFWAVMIFALAAISGTAVLFRECEAGRSPAFLDLVPQAKYKKGL